jgi:predicted glycosyltransferase involved in capsule biosynthesis
MGKTVINLKDVTFLIPLKIESEDRKKIIVMLLDYIFKHLDTNVIICEEGKAAIFPQINRQEWNKKTLYIFRKNDSDLFHKTKNLNLMIRKSKTPIIVSQDSDVLFYPQQYHLAAQAIRGGILDFCYPFNKPNHNITKKLQQTFSLSLNLSGVEHLVNFEHPSPPPGGCFFINKDRFIKAGMENENFVSWGPEDVERRDRLIKLGFKVGSIEGKLFHLDHSRTANSDTTNSHFQKNEEEYRKILSLSPEDLRKYVETWTWTK